MIHAVRRGSPRSLTPSRIRSAYPETPQPMTATARTRRTAERRRCPGISSPITEPLRPNGLLEVASHVDYEVEASGGDPGAGRDVEIGRASCRERSSGRRARGWG